MRGGRVASRRGAVLGRKDGGNTCRCFCLSYLSGLEDGLSLALPAGSCKQRQQMTYKGVPCYWDPARETRKGSACLFWKEVYTSKGDVKSCSQPDVSSSFEREVVAERVIVPLYGFGFLGRVS